jgi:Predicted Zn-dependent protease (DUF2268)
MRKLRKTVIVLTSLVLAGCSQQPASSDGNLIRFNDPDHAFGEQAPIIREVVESTLRRTIQALSITGVTITVSPDPKATIPGYGVGGYTPNAHSVNIALDPTFADWGRLLTNNLPQTLAHELHHSVRWRGPGYGDTLFEAMISEGLADRFAVDLLGIPPAPWSDAFPKEQTARFLALAQPKFDAKPYSSDDHARWFFGSDASLPKWTGYTLGYRLVEDYIEHHPGTTAATLVWMPARAFRPTAPLKPQEQSAVRSK